MISCSHHPYLHDAFAFPFTISDRHDITDILLKVALNTITLTKRYNLSEMTW